MQVSWEIFCIIHLVEFARVTPILPQRGRQPKGACPLDPYFGSFFAKDPVPALLHGASHDEAASARGLIVHEVLNF